MGVRRFVSAPRTDWRAVPGWEGDCAALTGLEVQHAPWGAVMLPRQRPLGSSV